MIGSSIPSNCSLGRVESIEDSVGDKALPLELINIKGRRYYIWLGDIVIIVIIVGFHSDKNWALQAS